MNTTSNNRDAVVLGVGLTRFGPSKGTDGCQLATEAAIRAVDDADIDCPSSLWIASADGCEVPLLASMLAEQLGCHSASACMVCDGDASGALALRSAYLEIISGQADVALVVGVEHPSLADGVPCSTKLVDPVREAHVGASLYSLYGMSAQAHMERFGTTREQLSGIAQKNRINAIHDEFAFHRTKVLAAEVSKSPMVANPLRQLDFAEFTDGAAAVVLASREYFNRLNRHNAIRVAGVGVATDVTALHAREDLLDWRSTREAAARAFSAAEMTPSDIDVAEVHDFCTLSEIMACEALGFFEPGQGGDAVLEGKTAIDGDMPINPSGGLLARGVPMGATGIAQIALLTRQLRQSAGPIQVSNAKRALAHCMAGVAATSVVTILEAEG